MQTWQPDFDPGTHRKVEGEEENILNEFHKVVF